MAPRKKPKTVDAAALIGGDPEVAPPVKDEPTLSDVMAEMQALRKRDAERDAELAKLKAQIPQDEGEKDYVHPPGPWDSPEIGEEVPFFPVPGGRDEAARVAYERLYSVEHTGVFIKMRTCGCSVLVTDIEKFPRYDMPCPCGRVHHRIVKYVAEGK